MLTFISTRLHSGLWRWRVLLFWSLFLLPVWFKRPSIVHPYSVYSLSGSALRDPSGEGEPTGHHLGCARYLPRQLQFQIVHLQMHKENVRVRWVIVKTVAWVIRTFITDAFTVFYGASNCEFKLSYRLEDKKMDLPFVEPQKWQRWSTEQNWPSKNNQKIWTLQTDKHKFQVLISFYTTQSNSSWFHIMLTLSIWICPHCYFNPVQPTFHKSEMWNDVERWTPSLQAL